MTTSPVRRVHQLRPQNQPDAVPYAPSRDLAYVYGPALREAIRTLDSVNWEDYFKGWMEAVGITDEQLADGVTKLCLAHELFVSDTSIKSPADALGSSGFLDVPTPVRIMIFERLGEVMLGGFFVALRDVTVMGQPPPAPCELPAILAAGISVSRRLRQVPPQPPDAATMFFELQSELRVMANAVRRQTEMTQAAEARATVAKQALVRVMSLPTSVGNWLARLRWCLKVFWTGKLE